MADDRDRDQNPEDLFDDLDSFFEPIEGVEWPEGGGAHASAEAVSPASAGVERSAPPPPTPTAPASRPRASEPEPTAERSEPVDQRPERADEEREPATIGRASEPLSTAAVAGRSTSEPTGEMSGADWRRLRDVLGDDDPQDGGLPSEPSVRPGASDPVIGADDPPPRPPSEPDRVRVDPPPIPAGQEPAARPGSDEESDLLSPTWPAAEVEDDLGPGELTLEDLKKAPPQYANLPGPREPIGPGDPHVQVMGDRTDEPSLADVEAMAENLAQEFRRSADPPTAAADQGTGSSTPPVESPTPPVEPGPASPEAPTDQAAGGPDRPGLDDMFEDDLLADFEAPPETQPPPSGGPRTVKVGQPEDHLVGPAWEEPTSKTITREATQAPERTGRNLPAAVLTGAILVAAALIAVAVSPIALGVVAGVVVLLAQAELYATMQRHGYQPATALGLVLGAMLMVAAYTRGEAGMLLVVAVGLVFTFFWFMASAPKNGAGALSNISVTLFGLIYVPFLAGYVMIILSGASGRVLVIAFLGLTFLYDIAAFAIGSYWGRRPLAPTISPKKSWEGLLGATVVTLLVSALLPSFGPVSSVARAVGWGLVVVIFAPLGDLAESVLKRDLGVKDMGSILPGHGGMLDRIDSALFVAPAIFYFLRLLVS